MTSRKLFIVPLALSFCLVLQAQAQYERAQPAEPTAWTTFIGQQLAESLESPLAGIRVGALENITALAREFGDEIDLKPVVPVLVDVFANDPDERCRLAAAAGLHAIGDDDGFFRMRRHIVSQESKRVQHVALAALMDKYGPEAFEGDQQMGRIAQSVLDYYDSVRLAAPVIATAN